MINPNKFSDPHVHPPCARVHGGQEVREGGVHQAEETLSRHQSGQHLIKLSFINNFKQESSRGGLVRWGVNFLIQ